MPGRSGVLLRLGHRHRRVLRVKIHRHEGKARVVVEGFVVGHVAGQSFFGGGGALEGPKKGDFFAWISA